VSALPGQQRLTIVPCDLARANAFIRRVHRHHKPAVGHKFCLAAMDDASHVRGVCTVGRPVARMLDDGWTAEVNRLATDGCANACSALYGAAWRVAKSMGYRRLITYILGTEPGTSLRAAGWRLVGAAGGGQWACPSRLRYDVHPLEQKQRWEVGEPGPFPAYPSFPVDPNTPQRSLFDLLDVVNQ
jgi:hypothetical protein